VTRPGGCIASSSSSGSKQPSGLTEFVNLHALLHRQRSLGKSLGPCLIPLSHQALAPAAGTSKQQ
jgi:hypothetical protein